MNLPAGDAGGVLGLCLEPHDLAIAKYVARRQKDLELTRALARRGYTRRDRLLELLQTTPVPDDVKARVEADITADFRAAIPKRRKP